MSDKMTPGPWIDNGQGIICSSTGDVCTNVTNPADARAIAALPELINTLKEQIDAVDQLCAKLIELTGQRGIIVHEQFYPSRSPIWPAMVHGTALMKRLLGFDWRNQ